MAAKYLYLDAAVGASVDIAYKDGKATNLFSIAPRTFQPVDDATIKALEKHSVFGGLLAQGKIKVVQDAEYKAIQERQKAAAAAKKALSGPSTENKLLEAQTTEVLN
ncbi:MAG: hypothetical protein AAFY15_03995 [Cyanobacteria bacterium J06648_11]